jgi:hypothetical protein
MKNLHKIQKVLHISGNLMLVVLLMGLIALPGASLGLMNYDEGKVLSSQSVRLNISLEDLSREDYEYDPSTDTIVKRDPSLQNFSPSSGVNIPTNTEPPIDTFIYDNIESVEQAEETEDLGDQLQEELLEEPEAELEDTDAL